MAAEVVFWILAVVSVGAALGVVLIRDIFRAALFLVLCFFTVAGIYVTLRADFLAAVQVLIYVGAVAVLLIFAVMLTVVDHDWAKLEDLPGPWVEETAEAGAGLTADLAAILFSEEGFILPLEIAGIMLLAAVIGAIVIMREK
jgi:NADH-quinone oxidoreductase subunit J